MSRRKIWLSLMGLAVVALGTGAFFAPPMHTRDLVAAARAQGPSARSAAIQEPAAVSDPVPVTATPPSDFIGPVLTPEGLQAIERRRMSDQALVDAAALRASYENYKRGRSRTPVSLSAFRSLEIRLNAIADADPSNTQARDMANAMKGAQYEMLRPSVEIAASANRLLYAHRMGEQMRSDGLTVEVSGAGNQSVRFISPSMTRQMAMQLSQSAGIPAQAKALQFRRVVFGNGRRSWSYDPARVRIRQ